jgi:hypothetical protein
MSGRLEVLIGLGVFESRAQQLLIVRIAIYVAASLFGDPVELVSFGEWQDFPARDDGQFVVACKRREVGEEQLGAQLPFDIS